MSDSELITGVFKEELKNRFLCIVEVDGSDTLCYISSSCRLSNFVDMTGKTVLLKPTSTSNSRTKYSVYALKRGKQYILLNMSQSNRLIENALHGRRFSFLGSRSIIRREQVIEGYKCDLFIEDTRSVIEVKSILSFEKTARFPTVFSQRAIDQLKKIEMMLDKRYKVIYLFVSMCTSVKYITINEEMTEFYGLFKSCLQKGMLVSGYSVCFTDGVYKIKDKVEIIM